MLSCPDSRRVRSFGRIAVLCVAAAAALIAGPRRAVASGEPRVIEAVPDNGDQFVDPGLTQLRVVFDRDMSTAGSSWLGGGSTFPRATGEAQWVDKRTCVLPVVLQPNHLYRLGINGGGGGARRFNNFRSVDGLPALPYVIVFETGPTDPQARAAAAAAAAPTPEQNRAAVEALREALFRRYSYHDRMGVDWNAVIDARKEKLVAAATPVKFAALTVPILERAGDVHISVGAGDITYQTFYPQTSSEFSIRGVRHSVKDLKRYSAAVFAGRIGPDLGYITIATWSDEFAEDLKAVYEALEALADTKGLVIDVRTNSGGDETIARGFAGCFVTEPVVYAQHRFTDPDAPRGFGPVLDRTLEPNPDHPTYTGRVVVLQGSINMSSCEAFLMMMQQVPGCTSIGRRSFGASGNPQPIELPNGVTVTLPSWRAMDAEGNLFEGRGLAPDIEASTPSAQFSLADHALEKAIEVLRTE